MKYINLLKAMLLLVAFAPTTATWAWGAFERPVDCLPDGATTPGIHSFNPSQTAVAVHADSISRFVAITTRWDASSGGVGFLRNGFGFEFKTYQYNYPEAATTRKGPAYVTVPAGFFYCDLPGCYRDSNFLSEMNSEMEYNEPQVTFGIEPGAAGSIDPARGYTAWTRAVAGRGHSSLLKVRQQATKLVQDGMGVSGYFLCSDVPAYTVVSFQDGVYSPTCVVKSIGSSALSKCAPPPASAICSQVSKTGGNEGANFVHNLAYGGRVSVQFEAYGVPDGLTVTQEPSGIVLLNTGYVSGYHSRSFDFNAGAGENVKVVVAGNQHATTEWTFRMSCPGEDVNSPIPRKRVMFYVKNNTCDAVWTISIDGGAYTNLHSPDLTVGPMHLIQSQWKLPGPFNSCGGVSGTTPGTLFYNDGRGEIALIDGFGTTSSSYFDVRQ